MSALIVTAELGPEDFAWFDTQRQRYFPPERNVLTAHLTMFHALPPSAEEEARRLLARLGTGRAPTGKVAGLMNLGRGVAYRIVSHDLEQVRADIAEHFRGMLTAQDAQGWRPHITVMNKAEPSAARAVLRQLEEEFRPRPLAISGLALHRYLGGPWERLGTWKFRG